MRKRVLSILVVGTLLLFSLYAQRILFSETIPLQGHINLQEKFTLDVEKNLSFNITQDMAGNTYQVATYDFFSNSPEVMYQLKLAPGGSAEEFSFRNIAPLVERGQTSSVPFKVAVRTNDLLITNEMFKAIRKTIGLREGSRAAEQGAIFITFPTVSEGFNLQTFSYGAYEALIAVEVSAD
ncbi:MAG: hypothetical protein ACOXZ4_01910 [Sphaerochaetaceae bacterium]